MAVLESAHKPAAHRQHSLPTYKMLDSDLAMGMSLGNSALFVITRNNGVIERVFSTALGTSPFGTIAVLFAASGRQAGSAGQRGSFVVLRPDGLSRRMTLHPAYQRSEYTIAGSIEIAETTFVPLSDLPTNEGDPPFVYTIFEVTNKSDEVQVLRATAFARLSGAMSADVRAHYDEIAHALVIRDRIRSPVTRFFGTTAAGVRYETTADFGRAYSYQQAPLANSTEAAGDILGFLQWDFTLEPGQDLKFTVQTAIYTDKDEREAVALYAASPAAEVALQTTVSYAADNFTKTEVLTPDRAINDGALWSKVNMRRVVAKYPFGFSATNDPATYSNVVLRDVSWFAHGSDFYMPWFSRAMLQTFAELQYPDGRMTEYYNAVTGQADDYGLNINDDTPLFIIAVNHHFRATGDRDWLNAMYPYVARAARYIIKQIDDRGLVFCSAKDPRGNLWAIASWRNIIPNYTINGAVTEINAECSCALRQTAELAREVGDNPAEAQRFDQAAENIRSAMDRHLINPANGLYYLNIDADDNLHSDITGDEVFPVIFNVCSEETSRCIVRRLLLSDFWTQAGLRTASYADPRYDPSAYAGLIGGVWPGLTWWFAFAAARANHPEIMVKALRSSFLHYAANPRANNTVPGQFSEWFDGETLANRGMRLSPWEPPRFLWAAVEGVCGLNLASDVTRVNPLVPADWSWVALRRLHYHGHELSYFAIRSKNDSFDVYSTEQVESRGSVRVLDDDVTDELSVFSSDVVAMALRANDGALILLLGNTSSTAVDVPFDMGGSLDEEMSYAVREYAGEEHEWTQPTTGTGAAMRLATAQIGPGGFRLLSFERSTP